MSAGIAEHGQSLSVSPSLRSPIAFLPHATLKSCYSDDIDTPQTALAPFHNDTHAHYWNSEQARHTTALGYTYPELQKWLPEYNVNSHFNEESYMNAIRAQLDDLYSTTAKLFVGQPSAQIKIAASSPTQAGTVVERNLFIPPKVEAEVQKHLDKITKVVSHAKETEHAPSRARGGNGDKQVEKNDYIVNILYEKYHSPFCG